jgi:hypothetical protein
LPIVRGWCSAREGECAQKPGATGVYSAAAAQAAKPVGSSAARRHRRKEQQQGQTVADEIAYGTKFVILTAAYLLIQPYFVQNTAGFI